MKKDLNAKHASKGSKEKGPMLIQAVFFFLPASFCLRVLRVLRGGNSQDLYGMTTSHFESGSEERMSVLESPAIY